MSHGDGLAGRLEDLLPIGRGDQGTTRLAWSAEDAAAGKWFRRQAAAARLSVERDPAGNLWAMPDAAPPWWALGSHLDTVRQGGSYDGALGVAAAFEVACGARVPVAVISFADEEGARFNTPTFGSRALTGALDLSVLDRRDADGVSLADAMRSGGVDPTGLGDAPEWLSRARGFIELHIDQTPDLERAHRPVGIVRRLVARLRLRAELSGRAGHAGTTPPSERRDALAAAARLIVAAEALAAEAPARDAAAPTPNRGRPARAGPRSEPSLVAAAAAERAARSAHREEPALVATASRIEVEPNALTTLPAKARVWLDARAPEAVTVRGWRAGLERVASEIADRTGVAIRLSVESENPGSEFDPELRARLARLGGELGEPAPELDCYAGHDAGVLAARVPAAMVLVRNPAGVSHSPEEAVDLEAAAFGVELLRHLVEEVAG